jgi:hypothetical protein
MDFFLSRCFCSYQIRQNTFFAVAGGHTIRRRRFARDLPTGGRPNKAPAVAGPGVALASDDINPAYRMWGRLDL